MPATAASLLTRVRSMDPRRRDRLIAALAGLEFQVEATLADLPGPDEWVLRGLLVAYAAGLAFRTRAPLLALGAGFGGLIGISALGQPALDAVLLPFFGLIFLCFSLGLLREGRELHAGVALALTATAVAGTVDPEAFGPGVFIFVGAIIVGGPVMAGRALRNRTRLAQVLREKAEMAERERAEAVTRAVMDERGRIAGELHDVVSHALSAMVVQAAAARRLAPRDPASAREAFAAVERSGREALDEMRRLLGVLRRADEDLALAPQPSLDHLGTLVRRHERAGLPVDLEVLGDPRPLSIGSDLVAYRVVQDALRSAAESGTAGRARVRVTYAPGHVDVEVRDDGGGRRDLLGVHERVALYGGRLVAGGARGGGHAVRARLPAGAQQ